MIDMIANIATILGFSVQVYESFKTKHPGPLGESIGLFVGLTDTVQCWKQIHHDYQSLSYEIDNVRMRINRSDNTQRPPGEILPKDLRDIFEGARFSTAIYQFQSSLDPSLFPLRQAALISKEKQDEALRKIQNHGLRDLSITVHEIVILQRDTVALHDEFCGFLGEMRSHIGKGEWQHSSDVEFILNHRMLLLTKFNMIIINADKALLNFLDIFRFTANQIRS
jgi:hypothetical protein